MVVPTFMTRTHIVWAEGFAPADLDDKLEKPEEK
jgi:hypothetical protein